jgi:hypothetical protein
MVEHVDVALMINEKEALVMFSMATKGEMVTMVDFQGLISISMNGALIISTNYGLAPTRSISSIPGNYGTIQASSRSAKITCTLY